MQMKTMHRVSQKLSDLQMHETSNFPIDQLQQVSPVHSVPETNLTSTLSLNQLEHVLLLLLSPVTNGAGFTFAIGIREDS